MGGGSVPAGTRVGRYEIVSLLRQGGMGEVYAADDRNLGRRVALKILPRNRTSDPERVARFVREARASSTLNHPSIVAIHDAGSEGGLHFLAMELIDGQPLSEWLRRRQALTQRIEVMAQVAEGLARAHDAGIVHRDLKPDNVMVTADGRAKIVDFGIAKLTERNGERMVVTGVTTPTSRVGTTAYMAPEQIEGKTIDHRTDVFAFGVVLFEVLTGANPFAAAQYADTIHNVVHLEPSLDGVPRALRRIVKRCLNKDAELRYDSMRDIALDLRETELELAPPRKRRRRLATTGALIVVLAGVGGWLWSRRDREVVPQRGMTMTRLTHNGRVSTAALSPDGKYLVHAVHEGAEEALYVKQIATGTLTKIADAAPRAYFDLKVSADGNYAYYTATERREPNVANLYQISLLGGAPRLIAADTEFGFSLSPDGTQVAFRRFSAFDREHRLTIAPVDGSGERVVLRRKYPRYAGPPVWTPDGASITFAGGDETKRENGLYRLTLATGAIDKISTPDFPGVGSFAWLPDDSGLLATVFEREQPPQIWFVPNGSMTARKVTSEVSGYFDVTPSADSQSFAAVRDVSDSNIYTMTLGSNEIHALTSGFGNWVGGGGVRWLSEREVAFSTVANGENTVFAVDTKGGTPRRVMHHMLVWRFTMSPDEQHIAFVSNETGAPEIWMAGADGTNARQITRVGNAGVPSFTPDGRAIIFVSFGKTQYAWRVPIDGSTPPVQLTDLPTNQPLLSPDGTQLLCRLRSPEANAPLWRTAVVRMDGSAPPRFFDVPRFGGDPILQWHPNGHAFLYADYEDGVANIWMQDLDGSAPHRLTSFESGAIFGFDLAADGKRLALARGQQARDAVLIRDFR